MQNYMIINKKPKLPKTKNRKITFKNLEHHAKKQRKKIIKYLKKHDLINKVEYISKSNTLNILNIKCDKSIVENLEKIPNIKKVIKYPKNEVNPCP